MAKQPATAQVFQFRREPPAIPTVNLHVARRVAETPPPTDDRPAIDLSGKPKIILLIGPGGGGKTTLARCIGEDAAGRELFVATMDPTTRTLANYGEDVEFPKEGQNPVVWLRTALDWLLANKKSGVIDFGPGVAILSDLLVSVPSLEEAFEEAGMALVLLNVLSPRVQSLGEFMSLGFQPEATAFVYNLGTTALGLDRASQFDTLRAQPAVVEAVQKGAREIWFPALDSELFTYYENSGQRFTGSAAGLQVLEGLQVRAWNKRRTEAFAPVASWLP